VRTLKILIAVLLVGVPAWLGAQAAPPKTGAPEIFNGNAQVKNANGAMSGTFEVRVARYTPDFDRTTVEKALRQGGYPAFLTALRNSPEVGQLVLAGGQVFLIRYAREKVEATGRTITVVTEKPVFFVGSSRADAKPRAGFEVAVVQLQMDGTGKGKGTMAAAARVRPDGDGGVRLDDYAEQPITLTDVVRKPL
jgi:hypothetical protein